MGPATCIMTAPPGTTTIQYKAFAVGACVAPSRHLLRHHIRDVLRGECGCSHLAEAESCGLLGLNVGS